MADERKIVIVLKAESGEGASQTEDAEKVSTGANDDSKKNSNTSVALAAMAAKQLTSLVVSEGLQWANYEWEKNLTLNDDYIGQRAKTIALQQVNKGASVINNIFSSAASGLIASAGNPVGAAVGALIGLVASVASISRENYQTMQQQDIQLAQMEAQLNYTRQRQGWSTEAASIGEDL